jgi:hypothetical protein
MRAFFHLYGIEIGLALLIFGLYKAPVYDLTLLSSPPGIVIALGLIGVATAAARLLNSSGLTIRAFAIALAANLVSLVVALGISELSLRMLAFETADEIRVGNIALQPTWSETVARNRTAMAPSASAQQDSYFTYDPDLGWTVGPSRRSANGLYFSSAEGIRSPRIGMRYADEAVRPRVALIGDSNAFSLEVPFGDSLGSHLQTLLGETRQVLNFGVNGYGIDQIYLRYQRDVRPWKPRVVVVVFIEHDLVRTMGVYPFVSLGWTGLLVKPRFVLHDDKLSIINDPLPSPGEILGAPSVEQLPAIKFDPGFDEANWRFRFEHELYAFRLVTSAFPRWGRRDERQITEQTQALNGRIFRELNASILQQGSVPIFVYLPRWSGNDDLTQSTLRRASISAMDMTACLQAVPEDQRRVPGGSHYTGIGNEALARCTAPSVRSGLSRDTRSTP